jgi:hypothetical protein
MYLKGVLLSTALKILFPIIKQSSKYNEIGRFRNEEISHTLGKREKKSISISIETCGVGGTLDKHCCVKCL